MRKNYPRRSLRIESLEDRLALTCNYIGSYHFSADQYVQVAENSIAQVLTDVAISDDVTAVGPAESGTAELTSDGKLIYTPNADFVGVDSFTIRCGSDVAAIGTTSIESTVHVNVTESVYALPDWIRVAPGNEPTTLDVRANDYVYQDRDENSVALLEVDAAEHGSVSISEDGLNILYRAKDGFEGIDSFTYTIRDAYGNESSATAKVEVTSNDSQDYFFAEHYFIDALSRRVKSNQSRFGSSPDTFNYTSWLRGLSNPSSVNCGVDGVNTPQSESTTPSHASTTNLQTVGVDEGDIVKRFGDHLYIASGNVLRIVDVQDAANPTLAETKSFDDPIVDLYAAEGRVTVITEPSLSSVELVLWPRFDSLRYPPAKFSVHVLDVSDTANITQVYSTNVDGDYLDSRLIDGILYTFVDHRNADRLRFVDVSGGGFYESVGDYVTRITETMADVGTYEVTNASGTTTGELLDRTGGLVALADARNLCSIITFDTTDDVGAPMDWDTMDVSSDNFQLYVSTEAIYVLGQTSIGMNSLEILPWRSLNPETSIQKFAFLSEGAGVEFAAAGAIDGVVIDQFSVDEHGGYFRIVTEGWDGAVNVSVMSQDDDSLALVGSIEDIAPGELVYSARFDGDRAFVTTFRTVDPLFVIDLSDPTTPTIDGELKIPGYSNYMQVINDDYVLGIGRDADEFTGLTDGLQVSLFNVSDPNDPQIVANYEFAGGRYTWSIVADTWGLRDHHAVTFDAETGVLAIPIWSAQDVGLDWGTGGNSWDKFRSRISVLQIDVENESIERLGEMKFDDRARRSLQIDDYLYGISSDTIQVSGLLTPDTIVARIDFSDAIPTGSGETGLPVMMPPTEDDPSAVKLTPKPANSTGLFATDVNNDGLTTPLDALILINAFNQTGHESQSGIANNDQQMDVNGDQLFTPLDLLIVINWLNEGAEPQAAAQETAVASPSATRSMTSEDASSTASDADEIMNQIWARDQVPSVRTTC